jgi:hypothetical protein
MHFADWFAPVMISSSAEYSGLQALQLQEVRVRRMVQVGQA